MRRTQFKLSFPPRVQFDEEPIIDRILSMSDYVESDSKKRYTSEENKGYMLKQMDQEVAQMKLIIKQLSEKVNFLEEELLEKSKIINQIKMHPKLSKVEVKKLKTLLTDEELFDEAVSAHKTKKRKSTASAYKPINCVANLEAFEKKLKKNFKAPVVKINHELNEMV